MRSIFGFVLVKASRRVGRLCGCKKKVLSFILIGMFQHFVLMCEFYMWKIKFFGFFSLPFNTKDCNITQITNQSTLQHKDAK